MAGTAFDFQTPGPWPDPDADPQHLWIEFRVGDAVLVVTAPRTPAPDHALQDSPHLPWIYVEDLDAHYARARQHGARIIEDIHQRGYRAYVAQDPEGGRWCFAQARPTMAPAR